MRYRFMRFPGGKTKAVTFSYDDGVRQDIRFSEMLNQYGLKGTFNHNNSALRADRGLTREEVVEYILNKGHEVALHGSLHRAEGTLRPIEGIRDVLDNRLELEAAYGIIIRGMAYPDSGITYFTNGADYESIRRYLKDLDVAYARTLSGDNDSFALPQDFYAWMPTAHHDNPRIFEYIDSFLKIDLNASTTYGAKRQPRLFYLWGHSYEFDLKNNWEHMEEICKKLSFREDTWYATNMEIYNYVTAYQSLIFSADGMRVYNPSLQTVFFDVDREVYSVEPGETILLEK